MVVLLLVSAVDGARVSAAEDEPPSFFPLQARWTADLEQPVAAAPAVDDRFAFAPLRDGTLVAIDLLDGSTVWATESPSRFPPLRPLRQGDLHRISITRNRCTLV